MRVFLSWSGDESKQVAEALRGWLPSVIQAVKPYFSPNDIDKGTQWNASVSKELNASAIGILCITKDNLHAPWIMFEAGALSKSLDNARVIPLLIGLEPTDLTGPLTQFQAAKFEQGEVRKMMGVINAQLGELALLPETLANVFDKWWPDLEKKINDIQPAGKSDQSPARSDRELLEEVLVAVRRLTRTSSRSVYEFDLRKQMEQIARRTIQEDARKKDPVSNLERLWYRLSDESRNFLAAYNLGSIDDLISARSVPFESMEFPSDEIRKEIVDLIRVLKTIESKVFSQ